MPLSYRELLSHISSFFLTGIRQTRGCVIRCQALHHEQKQSRQPVLQCGSGRLNLHRSQALPEPEADWLWGSGNSLVSRTGLLNFQGSNAGFVDKIQTDKHTKMRWNTHTENMKLIGIIRLLIFYLLTIFYTAYNVLPVTRKQKL